jgi:hypothetical protein
MRRAVPILLALTAVAAAALAANLVLLRYATSNRDPVGKLSPRATVITTPQVRTGPVLTVTLHATTGSTEPARTTTTGTTADDRGGGHGSDD